MSTQSFCYRLLLLIVHFALSSSRASSGNVSAIIVFGDSTVDTGNNNFIPTIAKANFPPYGCDFDGGVATGRFSNGRLVTDFVSEMFGLPSSVPAYLDTGYTIDQLTTGLSFASAGAGLDDFTAKFTVSKFLMSLNILAPFSGVQVNVGFESRQSICHITALQSKPLDWMLAYSSFLFLKHPIFLSKIGRYWY
ncbi:hypothetical protein GQ55_2G200600 [Panicum hallii var. hallii]|uniref:GDSL esterase/lipase n=1 Tax=Panicum hallii var. hallii TaxID=1504633 RepID=A0A2T7EQN3_9POAL|nr:hypothetical protein GQ55_2G200600 [Panicum hallii var. hallii]